MLAQNRAMAAEKREFFSMRLLQNVRSQLKMYTSQAARSSVLSCNRHSGGVYRMIRIAHVVGVVAFTLFIGSAHSVWAIAPNPLENAYWRFEEGTNGDVVSQHNANVVLDSSGNNNAMRAFFDTDPTDPTHTAPNPANPNPNASPRYTDFVPPKPLKSGLTNSLGMQFVPFPNGKDIYADTRNINNGMIAPGGGFTIEAAFNANDVARKGTIIGKEGRPKLGNADTNLSSLPTFSLMTNADDSHLMVQQFDGADNLATVESLLPLTAGQWYYTAVVNDGTSLSLYLDSGSGYELQGSVGVAGALYQGPEANNPADYNHNLKVDTADYVSWRKNNSSNPTAYSQWRANFGKGADWNYNWSIGRGVYGGIPSGSPANWFDGYIDEVRLSNVALSQANFLFAPGAAGVSVNAVPEPSGLLLAALALSAATLARRRRRFA
jgi:hypothetical protein